MVGSRTPQPRCVTMALRRCLAVSVLVLTAASSTAAQVTDKTASVDFQRQVRPILAGNCFQCHGPDARTRQAKLRLDTQDGAFADRPTGTPVVPGDPEKSLLYQRIAHASDRMRMPPPRLSDKTLSAEQVELLRRWIAEGASWDQHWSFKPVSRIDPPSVTDEAWVRTPIDRFVLARLEAEGLAPAPEADRRTLARRVALDLTGLPPDAQTLASFLSDTSEGAFEALVDRLLESKHWGEHRARYWLDAARYGDTHGIHIDNYREMYFYRDWVIAAYNDNKPFDEFVVEQIAGDLLPNPTVDQLIATGFHRNNITTNEGGAIPEEYEAIYAKDRADTTASVFLGLTAGCATCHDHKFDPIAQREFYALTAFFRNTTQYVMDGNISDPPPVLVVPSDEDRDRWHQLQKLASETGAKIKDVAPSREEPFAAWLASGRYRSLTTPLEASAALLTLDLDGAPSVEVEGERTVVALHEGAVIGEGPSGQPALRFGEQSWAELPSLSLDRDTPFSLSLWVYHPEEEGDFVVAGQHDPADELRGWTMGIGGRMVSLRMTGDKPPEGEEGSISVSPINTKRLPAGDWTHIVVAYDGSGERAGLEVYRNGDPVEVEGSEFFAAVEGSIGTTRPLYLGKGVVSSPPDAPQTRFFSGGGIADLRVFNRRITAQEARVVSQWPMLQRARKKAPEELDASEREALRLYYLAVEDGELRRLAAIENEIAREWREIRRRSGIAHVMLERPDAKPEARVLFRGMYDQPRERVVAGTPAVLPPMSESLPRNRMGLARWLVDDANPLTSRVMVNRYWQQVFGTGLVATSDDFGAQGEPPSHPELLDWLASEFRQSGWDTKQFFRLLVTSSTYRQSAQVTKAKLERDPGNRLLSRGPRFRMDAEMVRDCALAASGLLVRKIGGPSVKPYQPEGVWEMVAMPQSNTRIYRQDSGDKLYRRSLYTFWKRSAPPASMDIFNAPTREHATVERERTNTPLQALVTMNDTQFVEAARTLAQKAMREAGDGFDTRLDYVTTRLLSRDLDRSERVVAKTSYDGFLDSYRANPDEAGTLLALGDSEPDEGLPAAESAAWTMLTSELMNLDEVLNK
jgi:mono/diheme cytochrome c family protein